MGCINSNKRFQKNNKKGFIFTVDAILAITILILGIIVISKTIYVESTPNKQISYASEDIINVLANKKMIESNDPYIIELINNGSITYVNNSIIEQIGHFWAEGKTSYALSLSSNITEGILPKNMGLVVLGEDSEIYSYNNTEETEVDELVSYKTLISGIALAQPIRGTSSRIYIKEVDEQARTEYIYFGGFEGEGNITKFIYLPNFLEVNELYLEVAAIDSFKFYINNILCDNISITNTNTSLNLAEGFDLSSCNSSFLSGQNNYFTIEFDSNNINESYIGGGFIKVSYKTTELYTKDHTTHKYYFPGIVGLINLYSSIYPPGNLTNMEIYLHYEVNNSNTSNTLFLNLGNTTIYEDTGTSGIVTTTINNSNLSSILDYSDLSLSTTPVRFGFRNLSFQNIIGGREGRGDAVLITDESGSMAYRMDSNSYGTTRSCSDPNLDQGSTTRMSVAKCVDKDFIRDVLENVTGNRLGLVSYAYYTNDITNLTTDIDQLEDDIDDYVSSGATCISCGIYDATQLLLDNYELTLNDDTWLYTLDYQYNNPPSNWTSSGFNDNNWTSGTTIIGFGSGVDTEIEAGNTYPDLWDMAADSSTNEIDFTSGINYTANTFYSPFDSSRDDGWDWSTGVYDYSSGSVSGVVSGRLRLYSSYYYDTSAAYGTQINITQSMYDLINTGAIATVSLDYEWDGRNPYFESSDQVWIKGRWYSPYSGSHYLGSSQDSGHSHSDGTFEIDTRDNPDNDFDDSFTQDISTWIEGPGYYYLDFGGKLDRSWYYEYGYFYFDNILLSITNEVGNLYFRNNFTIDDLDTISNGSLHVYSDDKAEVYLNGNIIDNDTTSHNASYWNRDISFDKSNFNEGENILAVKLYNNDAISAKFDLELIANSTGRVRAMLIMSDGEANRCHGPDDGGMDNNGLSGSCGTSNSKQEAIDFACYAHTNYNISIYSVGFSSAADTTTLQSIADCDNSSHFYQSDNVTGLQEIYQDIAAEMINAFVETEAQTIIVSGNFSQNTLYTDSYIELEYSSSVDDLEYGEMPLFFEEYIFNNSCSPSINIPSELEIIDSKVTSYSGLYWTNYVKANSNKIFDLNDYGSDYIELGDPFIVNIAPSSFSSGSNTLQIRLGTNQSNTSLCSQNNSLIYTGVIDLLNVSLPYSEVLPVGIGCTWLIEFEDETTSTINVPVNYVGNNSCNFTSTSVLYNNQDSYDVAMYALLNYLDFDNDHKVYVNFEASDLVIDSMAVERVPYLWGPSILEVRVWQ
jgi:hypothetical protein